MSDAMEALAAIVTLESEIKRLRAINAELLAALKAFSALYTFAWDRVDGGLMMMERGVERFEQAHAKAVVAIAKAKGEAT